MPLRNAELRCASTESKSLLWNLHCALEIKNIKLSILRCAEWLKRCCAFLRCAFGYNGISAQLCIALTLWWVFRRKLLEVEEV